MNTQRYECPGCGYVYDEARGDAHEGFPPGTQWSEIPEDWCCPDCAVRDKADFLAVNGAAAESAQSAGGAS